MMHWNWSYAVWSAWLLEFLLLELLGVFRVGPWVTLSETSWHAEDTYHVLYKLLAGFLLGLSAHITLRLTGNHHITLWKAVAFGMMVAFAAPLMDPELP